MRKGFPMNAVAEFVRLDAAIEPKVREWIDSGRGLLAWENQEIGSSAAQYVYTPAITNGRQTDKPVWRYGNPQTVDVDRIVFVDVQVIQTFRAGLKRFYWGMWLTDASEAKAERLLAKIRETHPGAVRSWSFDPDNPGKAIVEIGVEQFRRYDGTITTL